MKYDSGMTRYHNDIIATLRLMCGDNSEIAEKFSPKDGSSAPLRDYLKGKYRNMGKHSNGVGYWCTPSKGVEVYFNGPGDKTLTLTWSQTAKFIRENWDEVFKKSVPKPGQLEMLVNAFDEDDITCPNWKRGKTLTYLETVNGVHFECKAFSMEFCKFDDITRFFVQHCNCPENCMYNKDTAENQPSYIDKLREKYPKVSETDEWFDTVYCPSDLFDGDDVNDPGDDKCDYTTKDDEACQKCWRERCPAEADLLRDPSFEIEYFEHYHDETPDEPVPEATENETEEATAETAVIVQDENTEVPAAFDYSELDGDTAKNLRDCETVIRKETAGYFTLLGAKFKEAQELLADHSSGTFEKWYAAMGFKRQTVYNLIRRYEFLNSPTIGGRTEAFEALPLTLSYEVSKPDAPKELVEKALDGDITTNAEYLKLKAELEEANKKADFWIEANSKANEENQQLREDRVKAMSRADNAEREFSKLQAEIKELESRPVDVAVQHDPELAEELAELREENERLKNGNIKSFIIRLTLDEYDRLLDKVDDDFNLKYIIKHAKLLKL